MTVAVTINPETYVFHYYILLLSKSCPWVRAHFLVYLRALLFVVLHQHPLMVQVASSSKSNHSQAKSTHKAFKVGPPGKLPVAVSVAKAKQSSIKKFIHSGNFFSSLSGYTSDVELEQMKTQSLFRKKQIQVRIFSFSEFVLLT